MDDAPTPFQPQVSLTLEEDLLEQNTREGLRALFYWAVFPFPLALIPLAWLSRLPFVGLLAGVAGLVVLIVWAMRARAAWGDKAGPWIARAWDAIWALALTGYQKVSRGTQGESVATPPAAPSAFAELEAVAELPRVQWDTPVKDTAHEQYRIQYERLVDVIPSLSRDDQGEARHDRRKTLLTLAEILDGLHIYGDDPLAYKPPPPPVPEPEPAPRPMGFAGLPVPVPGFSWLRILPYALVGLSVAANGVLFASWRGAEREADQIEERARQAEARVENLTVALDQYSSAINQAQQNVRVSVDTLAEERARRVEAERRLRRDRDANRQVDVGGPAPDWLGLMQQHEPVAPGDSGNADPAPSADDPG